MTAESGVSSPSARAALSAVATDVVELRCDAVSADPLEWPGYLDQLSAAAARTGETESVIVADGAIGGRRATFLAFDFGFLGGSMGEATGTRITHAFVHARERRQPLISLVASGGARVQEGMRSLVQMQRISEACAEARRAGTPHISVVRNPTTGGVWTALTATADVIIGVAGATVSFAGSRVRGDASDDVQFTADGTQSAGFLDAVAPAEEVPRLLAAYVRLLGVAEGVPLPCPLPEALGTDAGIGSAWELVCRARSAQRPRAQQYLDQYFNETVQISGDRVGGKDDGMLCGFGLRDGRTVAYAAQTGTANTAAGFRTATRLIRLADRLRLPVLTLIDTPGADNSSNGELAGVATAIGETFIALREASVPITTLVIGEGGSGGALALAATDRLWLTPDSYFSVISPESAAAILFHDRARAAEIAELLRLRPAELLALGVAQGIQTRHRDDGQPAMI